MTLETWKSQLRKGAAELAILSLLDERPRSGIELIDHVTKYPSLGLSEGTIYPLLSRLVRDGKLDANWMEHSSYAKRIKIYALTDKARENLAEMRENWNIFQTEFSTLLSGGRKNGN